MKNAQGKNKNLKEHENSSTFKDISNQKDHKQKMGKDEN
jgi:hypothetical protein